MSDPVEILALYATLEQTPGDMLTLQALGDWFEEHDEPKRAECIRWLAETERSPFQYSPELPLRHHFDKWKKGWYWWTTAHERKGWGYPKSCRLPRRLWERMVHGFDYDPAVFKEYASVRDALEAVMAVWTRRPPTPPKRTPKAE